MKALRTIDDKDLAKVSGGALGGLTSRTKVSALGLKPVAKEHIVRDPRTSALYPKWQEFGI